jgi:hypothetical protein
MALCINCHTTDKGFFAPRCHACNEECGFLLQCATSIVATGTYLVATLVILYFIGKLIF